MYDELVKRLHRYSENCVAYKLDADFADAVQQAADAIELLGMKLHGDEAAIAGMKREIERMVVAGRPRWIPVAERLPEINKYVLGCFKDNSMTAVCFFDRDEHMTFWRACTDEGWEADCDSEPTHWMPLPEPPKEE